MAGGRPSSFKEEYLDLAYKFALLGATDKQMAYFFDVSEVTLNAWKKEYPEFLKSLKKGKDLADAEVAKALYHRAKGYSHPEIDIKMYMGEIIETPITKHYPPDTGACMAWLKNRQPDKFRDRVDDNGAVEKLSDTISELVKGMKLDKEHYTRANSQDADGTL